MNLRSSLARFGAGLLAAASPSSRGRVPQDFPDIAEWLFGHDWPKDPNDHIYPSVIGKVATAYACIGLIANHIATAKVTFYRGEGKKRKAVEREKGNIVDVWESANGTITGFEMERDRQMWLDTSGSSYLYCERDSDNYPPHALWNMPSALVNPVPTSGRRIEKYLWGDARKEVRANRVLAWRYMNPGAETQQPEIVGLSPLAPIQRALSARASMIEWLELVFVRGGGTSLVLNIKDHHGTGIADVEGLHRKWQAKYGGKRGWLNPIFLQNVELLSKGFGPHDIKWEEISRQLDLDILRVFHVPPVLMGIKEGGGLSDAGAATDWQVYALCSLAPRIKLRDAVLNEHYCPMWGEGFSAETDMNQVPAMLDLVLKQAVQVSTLVSSGLWTPNEGREMTGRDPLEDPEANELRKKQAPEPPITEPEVEPAKPRRAMASDPYGNCDAVGCLCRKDRVPCRRGHSPAASEGDPKAALRSRVEAMLLPYERSFEDLFRDAFRKDLERVEGKLAELETDAASRGSGIRLLAALDDADLLDPNDPELEAAVEELYRKAMKKRSKAAAAEVASSVILEVEAAGLAALIRQEAASLVTGVRETTRRRLSEAIASGIAEQKPYAEIVADVRSVMAGRMNDAATIARTETNWVYNYAAAETWREAGVETISWLTIGDDAVRPTHTACEAEGEIKLGALFSNGLRYPGDRSTGDPAETINCFPSGTLMAGSVVGASAVRYSGPMLEVMTRGGRRLSVTPNHPVLGDCGFRRASLLKEGDRLLCYGIDVESPACPGVVDDEQNAPSRIEDVFRALWVTGRTAAREVSGHDFHNDGEFGKGEVSIVVADRELLIDLNTADAQRIRKLILGYPAVGCDREARERALLLAERWVDLAASGGVRRRGLSNDAGGIALDLAPFQALGLGLAANLDTTRTESGGQWAAADPGFVAQLLERGSGLVAFDEVVEVRNYHFDGHVYDLQSDRGWIVANGIFASNCRCVLQPGAYVAELAHLYGPGTIEASKNGNHSTNRIEHLLAR